MLLWVSQAQKKHKLNVVIYYLTNILSYVAKRHEQKISNLRLLNDLKIEFGLDNLE